MNNHDRKPADIDRRGFLKCMQWAGAGLVWSVAGGVPVSRLLGAPAQETEDFAFVQISDSHIGFDKAANPDVAGTFQVAVDKINSLSRQPDFILHTGDLSHLAKAQEFDTLDQLLRGLRQKQAFFVPGEPSTLLRRERVGVGHASTLPLCRALAPWVCSDTDRPADHDWTSPRSAPVPPRPSPDHGL